MWEEGIRYWGLGLGVVWCGRCGVVCGMVSLWRFNIVYE
jgi:hypothetical protein